MGQVQKSGFASGRTQSEQKEKEEEEEEEEEEALCRNTGLAYSFALLVLNPQTETLHYSCISTSLPTTLHLAYRAL